MIRVRLLEPQVAQKDLKSPSNNGWGLQGGPIAFGPHQGHQDSVGCLEGPGELLSLRSPKARRAELVAELPSSRRCQSLGLPPPRDVHTKEGEHLSTLPLFCFAAQLFSAICVKFFANIF